MAANSNCEVDTIDLLSGSNHKLNINIKDKALINKPKIGSLFNDTKYKNKINQLLGDSATYRFNKKYDFIFIDGAHNYEYIKNDTERSLKLLNPGGVIIWHDYGTHKGVTEYLNEIATTWIKDTTLNINQYHEASYQKRLNTTI